MKRLQPTGLPLYRQIFDALRYDIATGRLAPNQRLTPLRAAALEWGVNLHTVRHAYSELAKEGLIESLGAAGTRVIGPPPQMEAEAEIAQFVAHIRTEAEERYGLDVDDLCSRLQAGNSNAQSPPKVWFVECSHHQCRGHASEINENWQVDARPFSLEQEGEPEAGPIVATFFHYNDIRRRWPHRLPHVLFVAIRPNRRIVEQLSSKPYRGRIEVCELDEMSARNIVADLSILLPQAQFEVRPKVVARAADALDAGEGPVLFSPRTWAELSEQQQTNQRALELRYELPPDQLASLGTAFGWRPRHSPEKSDRPKSFAEPKI